MVESLAEPQLSTILALNVPSTSLSKHFKTSGIIKFLIHQCHVQKLLYGTACVTMCILKSELVIKISSDLYSFEKKKFQGRHQTSNHRSGDRSPTRARQVRDPLQVVGERGHSNLHHRVSGNAISGNPLAQQIRSTLLRLGRGRRSRPAQDFGTTFENFSRYHFSSRESAASSSFCQGKILHLKS